MKLKQIPREYKPYCWFVWFYGALNATFLFAFSCEYIYTHHYLKAIVCFAAGLLLGCFGWLYQEAMYWWLQYVDKLFEKIFGKDLH